MLGSIEPGDLLSRRISAFHEWAHRRHHSLHPQGRWRRSGRNLLFDDGIVVRPGIFQSRHARRKPRVRGLVNYVWNDVEWDWYTRGRPVLNWHWSPNNGWALDLEIRGWNECLITYVLAASAPRYPIDPARLSSRLRGRPQFRQRQILLRHFSAARSSLWRPTVLRALFLLRHRSHADSRIAMPTTGNRIFIMCASITPTARTIRCSGRATAPPAGD